LIQASVHIKIAMAVRWADIEIEEDDAILEPELTDDTASMNSLHTDESSLYDHTYDEFDLTVKSLDNYQSATLEAKAHYTIGYVKTLIENTVGIEPEHQRLTYYRNVLANDIPLHAYDNHSNTTVHITDHRGIQVFVKTCTGKTILIQAVPSLLITCVKQRIKSVTNIPPRHQRLMFSGRQLEHGRLSDYNTQNMSSLFLVLRFRGGMVAQDSDVDMNAGTASSSTAAQCLFTNQKTDNTKTLVESFLGNVIQLETVSTTKQAAPNMGEIHSCM